MKTDDLAEFVAELEHEGAHWVSETYSREDYEHLIRARGSLEDAKLYLREYWTLMENLEERFRAARRALGLPERR